VVNNLKPNAAAGDCVLTPNLSKGENVIVTSPEGLVASVQAPDVITA